MILRMSKMETDLNVFKKTCRSEVVSSYVVSSYKDKL